MSTDTEKMTQAFKDQFEKFSQGFKFPELDYTSLIENQRKAVDAVAKANSLSNEAAAEVSQKQLDIFRAASEHVTSMMRDLKLSGDEQRALAAKAFEAALSSSRELAEMTTKSNSEVFNLVKQRMTDNFDEMRKTWKS